MTTVAGHGFVSGNVQGVGFRAATRREALRLGLHGYARNLVDGRVEVLAAGEPSAVAALHDWLHHGPIHARVDRVEWRPVEVPATLSGFVVS